MEGLGYVGKMAVGAGLENEGWNYQREYYTMKLYEREEIQKLFAVVQREKAVEIFKLDFSFNQRLDLHG